MNTMKSTVFPILRMLIALAIAVALVKIAFFSGSVAADDDGLAPAATFETPTYVVGTGDVYNNVEITATVTADPARNVVSTVDGYVGAWLVNEGEHVEAGTVIVEVRKSVEATVDANGRPVPATFTRHNLTAPVAGTVHQLLIVDQGASIGTEVASINPGTLSIAGDVTPEQLFRLENPPTEATVLINNGPAEFTCQGLTIGAPTTAETTPQDPNDPYADPYADPWGTDSGSVSVKATCPVPDGTRLFAGMSGTMTLAAGETLGVITVPVTAVQGVYDTGRVWVIDPDSGAEEERDVVLGMSDGTQIEVREGLEEGETIRQYAPGHMEPLEDPGMMDPMMGMGG